MGATALKMVPSFSGRKYSEEDVVRIYTEAKTAKDAGLPMAPIFRKFAEELGTTPGAIEQRYYAYERKLRKQQMKDALDEGHDGQDGDSVKRIKAVNKFIYDTIIKARESKLDMKIVKRHLAEYLGLTVKALDLRFYEVQKILKNCPNVEIIPSDRVFDFPLSGVSNRSPVRVEPQPQQSTESEQELSIVDMVRKVVEERDLYKRLYEQLKSEMDELKKVLGVSQ